MSWSDRHRATSGVTSPAPEHNCGLSYARHLLIFPPVSSVSIDVSLRANEHLSAAAQRRWQQNRRTSLDIKPLAVPFEYFAMRRIDNSDVNWHDPSLTE